MKIKSRSGISHALIAGMVCTALGQAPHVEAAESAHSFDISRQTLSAALGEFARQADRQILFSSDLVRAKSTNGVQGDWSPEVALARLLEGTGLTFRITEDRTILIDDGSAREPGSAYVALERNGAPRRPSYQQSDESVGGAPPGKNAQTGIGEVVVTGTTIARQDTQALPVTVIDQSAMEARNALTPIELLTSLPQVGAIPLGESVSGSLGARGDNSSINLRGIGSNATLVLLNGRRLAPHPISATENGAPSFSVNVNQLPTRGLQRVDVLRDGASSLYGSDAVAGVINFVTTTRFRGTEVRARFGYPEEGGGQNVNATLTHGMEFAGGRGRYLTNLDVLGRQRIFLSDRDFSASADHTAQAPPPWNVPGSVFDGRAANLYPTFRIGTSTAPTYFRPLSGPGSTPGFTSVAPTRAANPEAFVDVNQYQEVQPESRRVNWFNNIEFDIGERLTLFSDLSLYKSKSQLIRNPVPFNAPNADLLEVISADNPYNPYGSHFYSPTGAPNADGSPRLTGTPSALTLQSELLVDGGADTIDIDSNVYRVVTGIRGKFLDTWSWESAGLYSWANSRDESRVGFRESLFGAALQRTDDTAYNPFGYTFKIENGAVVADQPYTNPQSVLSTIMQHQTRRGKSSIGSVDFRSSGEVVDLWAGPLSLGLGAEWRRETFSDHRPPFFGLNPADSGLDPNGNDYIQASPKPDSAGDRNVASAYGELVLPVVSDAHSLPLVQSLELSGSVRYEHYSDFGSTTNPKFSLNWKPTTWMTVRASHNHGFTAPNLPTLFFPNQYTVTPAPGTVDPYRNPVTAEGAYVMRNYTGSVEDLKPSDSVGKSAGVVIDVPFKNDFADRISASADYWQIKQTNLIGSLNATRILNNDALLLQQYTAQQLAAGVPVDQIDLGSGTTHYHGDPNVTRNAVTAGDIATFAAYNAAHPGAPQAVAGTIFSRRALYQNLSKGFVSGWDFSFAYAAPTTPFGKLHFTTDWTKLLSSYTVLPVPNEGEFYQERLAVDGNAKWRGTTTLAWRLRGYNATLSGYYIGSYTVSNATTSAAVYNSLGQPNYIVPVYDNNTISYRYKVRSTMSYNATGGYDFDQQTGLFSGARVRFGVVNLTNKEPPLSSTNFGYTSSTYSSLAVGRTWTFEISKEF